MLWKWFWNIFCFIYSDIQSRCDIILSRLSEASCGYFINEKKQYSKNGIPASVKLHAAHVLSMDALLAAGLELGSRAPQAWNHVFRYLALTSFVLFFDLILFSDVRPDYIWNWFYLHFNEIDSSKNTNEKLSCRKFVILNWKLLCVL